MTDIAENQFESICGLGKALRCTQQITVDDPAHLTALISSNHDQAQENYGGKCRLTWYDARN